MHKTNHQNYAICTKWFCMTFSEKQGYNHPLKRCRKRNTGQKVIHIKTGFYCIICIYNII
jgi:hypothetical protein